MDSIAFAAAEIRRSAHFEQLTNKIKTKTARVGVVGLGYVGLPLAVEYANEGYSVTGIDLQASKVDQINKGVSYIQDVPTSVVEKAVAAKKLRATADFSVVSELDTINICVPTPLRKTKDPDMSYIVSACEEIAKYIHPGMLVILESTTYPGTTDELVRPILEKAGVVVGEDLFLCFSPERVDPGNPKFNTKNIPKVVGGTTPACTEAGKLFYSQALQNVIPVASTQVAEMVKLLENTFRMINIGLVNEIAIMCSRMGINVWEVIEAAATKPFLVRGSGDTAFRSTRFIYLGKASRPVLKHASSNWPDISTGRCRILSSTRFRMR
jgi:UDP-N-acetyl-D-glucosamine dehydrogenase